MAEAVVPDGAQSCGQHMAQVAGGELYARQGHLPGLITVTAVYPAEGDGVFIEPNHPRVGDGGAADAGTEVVEGAGTGAGRLDVHSPGFAPDFRIDLPGVFFQ